MVKKKVTKKDGYKWFQKKMVTKNGYKKGWQTTDKKVVAGKLRKCPESG